MQWPKIRVLQAAERTYTAFFESLSVLLRLAGGWMLLVFVSRVGTRWMAGEFERAETLEANPAASWPLFLIESFVLLTCASAAAISWHRYVLLKERPIGALAVNPRVFLNFFLRGIIVFGMYFVAIMGVSALAWWLLKPSASSVVWTAASAALAVAVIGAVLLMARVCLVFPAAAIEERRMTFTAAWRLTKGNSWRLFWGAAVVVVPVKAVSVFADVAFERIAPGASFAKSLATIGTDVLLSFVGVAMAAGFASMAYRHFVEDRSRARSAGVEPTKQVPNS